MSKQDFFPATCEQCNEPGVAGLVGIHVSLNAKRLPVHYLWRGQQSSAADLCHLRKEWQDVPVIQTAVGWEILLRAKLRCEFLMCWHLNLANFD